MTPSGYVPYSVLIRMVHSFALHGEPLVAIFEAYVDESTDQNSLFVVGGFLAEDRVWRELEPEWLEALPSHLDYFHTTDCFSGEEQFKGIDIPERVTLLQKLTSLLASKDIHLIAYALSIEEYQELAPRRKENLFLGNRYRAALSGMIETACEYAIAAKPSALPKVTDRITVFFVEDNEYAVGVKRMFNELRYDPLLWWRIGLGTDTYGTKTGPAKIPLLQVADFGAFLAGKQLGDSPCGRIDWRPFYSELGKAGRVHKLTLITGGELKELSTVSH